MECELRALLAAIPPSPGRSFQILHQPANDVFPGSPKAQLVIDRL
jgi:hypothetical protein